MEGMEKDKENPGAANRTNGPKHATVMSEEKSSPPMPVPEAEPNMHGAGHIDRTDAMQSLSKAGKSAGVFKRIERKSRGDQEKLKVVVGAKRGVEPMEVEVGEKVTIKKARAEETQDDKMLAGLSVQPREEL